MSEKTKEEIAEEAEKIIRELEEGGLGFNLAYHGNPPFLLRYDKERKVFVTNSSYKAENHNNLSRAEALTRVMGSLSCGGV